jgi:hypothetical protein
MRLPDNADPLIPVFIPALVQLLAIQEQAKGAPLTESEVLEIRGKGICMMMPHSKAMKMDEARGYPDINPANVWQEWQAIRERI